MKFNYGVMQGRLSKKIGNKIQAFPEKNWKIEFSKAKSLRLSFTEFISSKGRVTTLSIFWEHFKICFKSFNLYIKNIKVFFKEFYPPFPSFYNLMCITVI